MYRLTLPLCNEVLTFSSLAYKLASRLARFPVMIPVRVLCPCLKAYYDIGRLYILSGVFIFVQSLVEAGKMGAIVLTLVCCNFFGA